MVWFDQTVEKIRKQEDLESFRAITVREGKKIVIFGAGICGHMVYKIMYDVGIAVHLFCDNNRAGHIDEETGLEIVGPDYLQKGIDDFVVLICVLKDYEEVCEQLMHFGFAQTQLHIMKDFFGRAPLGHLEENLSKYRQVYQILEDDLSQKVFLSKMKKLYLLEELLEIVSPFKDQYFDERIVLNDHEVFIDCGGYDGDTSAQFIKKCNGIYENIVIFEPEECKKADIEKNLSGYHYELYQLGLWSKSGKLYFDAMGTSSSRVSEKESDYVIDVAALDEMVYDKKPTFIKMDIEGAEQEALKGCRKIIEDFRPKLAICVYHKWEDLYDIPIMIKKWNPEYRFYLRQYSDLGFETVLYAL